MATAVDICNLALGKLGNAADVSSISPPDNSVEANYCATFYPLALLELLDKHNWNFATRRIFPATVTNNTAEWTYCYALPADYINVVRIKAAGVDEVTEYSTEISTTAGVDSYVLYVNEANIELKYCSSIVDPTKFPPLFVAALSTLLSSHLAGPLIKGDVGVAASQKQLGLANVAIQLAIDSDCQNYKSSLKRAGYKPAGIAARA
jgi:hypothetical protein